MFYILIIKNQFNKSILALPLFYFFKSPFQSKIRPFQGKIRPTYYREYYIEYDTLWNGRDL